MENFEVSPTEICGVCKKEFLHLRVFRGSGMALRFAYRSFVENFFKEISLGAISLSDRNVVLLKAFPRKPTFKNSWNSWIQAIRENGIFKQQYIIAKLGNRRSATHRQARPHGGALVSRI
ncbi:MAG: hypothetical protein ACI4QA_07415 [Candidatus Spyradosoma sp.]